ncbi:MAG: Ig-like domain-containing protein, partial [Bacteroidales bacterium]
MAVLKSFELKGNKQSFANWVSNLSPKDVPFTSMIGKEAIDQTQYSWQTDSLAPATAQIIDEGEQFELQPRASTQVLTNFTSILRKEVSVSDSAMKVSTYGRNNEMAYQLKKKSCELMRDTEFMNLSIDAGRPGTATQASRYSGFKQLVAKADHPDQDTKAITHKEIPWFDKTAGFTLKDIFDITANLFLAGSKADKIMFHPGHIHIFSDHLGYNEEEPHVHRMFDDLDTRFNMMICKIKDPLGRMYCLIPNRYMPYDQVYFFHEDDWTQTILRAPQRIKIGKKGSSETMMIESEIGLRHRHPYASGVLGLFPTDKTSTYTLKRNVLTAHTGDLGEVLTFHVKNRDGTAAANLAITWDVSDTDILQLETPPKSTTAGGSAPVFLSPETPGSVTVRIRGNKLLSDLVQVEVRNPIIDIKLDQIAIDMGGRIKATTKVTRHVTGDPTVNDTVVTWHSSSPEVIFFKNPTGTTSKTETTKTVGGETTVYAASMYPGTYQIWSSVAGIPSKKCNIYVGKAQLDLAWSPSDNVVNFDLTKKVNYTITVTDKDGASVGAGARVNLYTNNHFVMSLKNKQLTTDANGQVTTEAAVHKAGNVTLYADCYGDIAELPIEVTTLKVTSVLSNNVIPFTPAAKTSVTLTTTVLDSKGTPMKDLEVSWNGGTSAVELGAIKGTTEGNGTVTVNVKGEKVGEGNITTTLAGHTVVTPYYVGKGGDLSFSIDPTPSIVGDESEFEGRVFDKNNNPIAGQTVTFTSPVTTWAIPDAITEADGSYLSTAIPLKSGRVNVAAACATVGALKTVAVNVRGQGRRVTARTSRSVATAGVDQVIRFTAQVYDSTRKVDGLDISIADPNGLFTFTQDSGVTDATGKWETSMIAVGKAGSSTTVFVECEGDAVGVPMNINAPVLTMELNPNPVLEGTSFAMTTKVFLEDGVTPVDAGVEVELSVTPNTMPEFVDPTYQTNAQGEVTILAIPPSNSDFDFQANIDTTFSNKETLVVGTLTVDIKTDGIGNMTNNIGQERVFTATSMVGGKPAAGMPIRITADNPNLFDILDPIEGATNDKGEFNFTLKGKTAQGSVNVNAIVTDPVSGTIASGSMSVALRNPKVVVTFDADTTKIDEELGFEIELLDQNNKPVKGIHIDGICDVVATAIICEDNISDDHGKIRAKIAPLSAGVQKVRGRVGTFSGAWKSVTVENKVPPPLLDNEPLGIGSKTSVRTLVKNDNGTPMSGAAVTWNVSPSNIVSTRDPINVTDSNGVASLELTGLGRGVATVSLEVAGMEAEPTTFLVGHGATVTSSHIPATPLINSDVTHKIVLKRDSDNAPIANTEVSLNCNPPIAAFSSTKVTTNAQGEAEFTHQFIDENTHTINVLVPSLSASTSHSVKVRDLKISSELTKFNMVYDDPDLPVLTIRMLNNTTPISGASLELRCVPAGCDFTYIGGQTTDSQGYIRVRVRPRDIGNFQLSARTEGIESNKSSLTVTDVAFRYSVSGHDRFMTAHIGQGHPVTCGVLEYGVPAVWKTLHYSTHGVDMVDIVPRDGGSAGATGFNTIDIYPKKVGTTLVRVQADGASTYEEFTVEAKDPVVHLTCTPNPADGTEDVAYTLKCTDYHGTPAPGVTVGLYNIASFNNPVANGNTDANGELLHIRRIAQPGSYPMQTFIPHASHVRSPMMQMVIKDRPYVYTVLGNLTKATHGIDLTHEVSITVRE